MAVLTNPMYPAVPFSPVTSLAADWNPATEDSFTVLNSEFLPDAPNLVTIGDKDFALVCRYTEKDVENPGVLGGLEFVLPPPPPTFPADFIFPMHITPVYRAFTSADYHNIIANIEALSGQMSTLQMQTGTITVEVPAGVDKPTTITYPKPFKSIPAPMVCAEGILAKPYVTYQMESNDYAKIRLTVRAAHGLAASQTITVRWMAFGELAD